MALLTLRNSMSGALIYAAGDGGAALLTGEFQWPRLLGMMLVGGLLYAIEIPAYFSWLARRFGGSDLRNRILRALLAQAFFNPLWIARHIALIYCVSGRFAELGWQLLNIGLASFLRIVPLAFAANYLIQNYIPLRWRFFYSAVFSATMAVYYAMSEAFFG
ncbi:hypothetical protein [Methylotuvimicrobium sp. KM2]|uniref:hypothetical protein n=1 Tax=Methylotuvimicrobium sp. KM2 TaxID=3133976 RepID=UPI0031010006